MPPTFNRTIRPTSGGMVRLFREAMIYFEIHKRMGYASKMNIDELRDMLAERYDSLVERGGLDIGGTISFRLDINSERADLRVE